MNILLIEDELRAGEKLNRLTKKRFPDSNIRLIKSVKEGIELLKAEKEIDLIFSDIHLSDGTSFKIFKTHPPTCPIIFCTAFDRYYMEAFSTSGIGYLLKPYSEEEFNRTVDKYFLLFDQSTSSKSILKTLSSVGTTTAPSQSYKTNFTIKKAHGVYLLPVEQIALFQANGDFVVAIDRQGKKSVINSTLSKVLALLDPKRFYQINRSEIIAYSVIHSYSPYTKNRVKIKVSAPEMECYTSNSKSSGFKAWLDQR